jgi:primosomal replication protein N
VQETNQLVIEGEVIQIEPLRYTPAGIPLLSLVLGHQSSQIEAQMPRRVECDVSAVLMGQLAEQFKSLKISSKVKATGFMARKSLKSTQLILHIIKLENI